MTGYGGISIVHSPAWFSDIPRLQSYNIYSPKLLDVALAFLL